MDMAPQNSRLETRDFRQSKPFEAGGPDLAFNAYFDRYDPISDPRNAVRELRSVVYEVKSGDRGSTESQHLLTRQFENRWCKEETISSESMNSLRRYELINQKLYQ